MSNTLKHSIQAQRTKLRQWLGEALANITETLPTVIEDKARLDDKLYEIFHELGLCKYVYVLDAKGMQISSTVNRYGADTEQRGRDRSQRPYMLAPISDDSESCFLSQAYISRNRKRPALTAIKTLRDNQGQCIGFFGIDFDLRELPHSDVMYEEPSQWRQIQGDPVIRQGLFSQQRVESILDTHLNHVMSMHEELMLSHGVHHFQMHFSSSRSTIWHVDDPYIYHILTMEDLLDADMCLAYPRRPYFERAIVPPRDINKILKQFKALRFIDETIYLRSASLNIVNGKIGLNFSCDGTHYLNYDEFLAQGLSFWFGGEIFPQAVVPAPETLDEDKLDTVVDEIASQGCMKVNKLLYAMDQEALPEPLHGLSAAERDYVYQELKSVMDVYEGGVCSI